MIGSICMSVIYSRLKVAVISCVFAHSLSFLHKLCCHEFALLGTQEKYMRLWHPWQHLFIYFILCKGDPMATCVNAICSFPHTMSLRENMTIILYHQTMNLFLMMVKVSTCYFFLCKHCPFVFQSCRRAVGIIFSLHMGAFARWKQIVMERAKSSCERQKETVFLLYIGTENFDVFGKCLMYNYCSSAKLEHLQFYLLVKL